MPNFAPIKFTKREQFIQANPDMPFDEIARQLNTCVAAIHRSYDRLDRKRLWLRIREHVFSHPVESLLALSLRFHVDPDTVRKALAPLPPTDNP